MPTTSAPKMESATVCAIVLNWNTPRATVRCLDSLLQAAHGRVLTIICCDNASTDDSVDIIDRWARARFRPLPTPPGDAIVNDPGRYFFLIRNGANLGYSGGNNSALEFAKTLYPFRYFWLLNSDVWVTPQALEALLRCAARGDKLALIGSTVVDADRPQRVQCAGGFRYWPLLTVTKKVFSGMPLARAVGSPTPRLDCISGASLFLDAGALAEVGGLDTRYFLYCEELDYALRIKQKGYVLDWCKESVVHHQGGLSTASRSSRSPHGSPLSHYHENLSTLKFTARHYPLLVPFAAPFRLAFKLATVPIFGRWSILKPLFLAYRDFLTGRDWRRNLVATAFVATPLFSGVDDCA